MTIVLLWDIDGTLLTTARAGVFALEEAAAELAGRSVDLQDLQTAGMTDAQIAERILNDEGLAADPRAVERFLEIYARRLPAALPRRSGRVLPGVAEVLADLDGDDRVLSLLLTGNVRAGAVAKLTHYGLDRWLGAGAFCEGPGARSLIAERAVALAHELADASAMFVIGDTPADVACADAVGVPTLAVATGGYAAADLRAAEAWHVCDRLPEPAAFRELIGA